MGKIYDSKLSKQDMLVVQVVSTVQPNQLLYIIDTCMSKSLRSL